ncbi:hypothetical protein [Actinobaculum sp. 352]|uniref:hypothetical protein n=1 Tax=Actinobaculum sp. 352 TaxID=2490946 RepID=UPI000F7E51F8|nr:hypothetical protein [Actinobaculum sp. 352]RTE47724.1 hypothetical protein EKN07_12100 [Actinobaculum sp. 352]
MSSPLFDTAVIVAVVAMVGGVATAGITALVQRRNARADYSLAVLARTVDELQEQVRDAEARTTRLRESLDQMDAKFSRLRRELGEARDHEFALSQQVGIWQDHVSKLERHINLQLPPPPPARPLVAVAQSDRGTTTGQFAPSARNDSEIPVDDSDDDEEGDPS